MDANYPQAIAFVLRWEGGLADDPDDHGGRTMKGVTQRVYDTWRQNNGLSTRDVAVIEDAELGDIYSRGYWKPARCETLRSALDLVTFDTSVNMGPGRAVRILQEAVGTDVDGGFGAKTQAACDACALPDAVVKYCAIREGLYHTFAARPGQAKFLRGWLNRLNDLRAEARLPGFTRSRDSTIDFGDTNFIERVPDLGPGQALEKWR
ncbi:glycosyl hydrolase 108 family protein [Reyranella sp.]|uniref:glycoside hydrolase family 108 protein n=1 Tax=Reyranella sp. TaxID=1929291 RepID=UPI00121D3736|nr:glycosyl hydrolase 108 family protein [Reyranella sp.]TAJ84763.1 MAG: hypothetical protein EPO50_19010 [Reyranella sp.]